MIKEKQLLKEEFVQANLGELEQTMQQDVELYKFLNTPAKDLPEQYKLLVQEISDGYANSTLLDLIKSSIMGKKTMGTNPLFSKTSNGLVGFAAYVVKDNEVTEIKIFSFNPNVGSGSILIRDLSKLLNELVEKYKKVSWSAMKINPINRVYQIAIQKYGGGYKEDGDIIYYWIDNRPLKKGDTFTHLKEGKVLELIELNKTRLRFIDEEKKTYSVDKKLFLEYGYGKNRI
jgi:hypothetical protein